MRALLRGKSIDGLSIEQWEHIRDRIDGRVPKTPVPDISYILPVPDIRSPQKDERPFLYIEDEVPPEYDPNQEKPEPKRERGEIILSVGYASQYRR